MDVIYIASQPYIATFGIKVINYFKSIYQQTLIKQAVVYAISTLVLYILFLGLAGLSAYLYQYILFKVIKKEVLVLINQVIDFTDKVVNSLNNTSKTQANKINNTINITNTNINKDIFKQVNITTTAINSTLSKFMD